MELKEEMLDKELARSNIPLILNDYNDIFSDFDPRPFNQRALSDDFLLECKRAARDKPEGGFELILSVPKHMRSIAEEFKIKKRLREHFKKHALEKEKDVKKMKNEGIFWVTLGVLILVGVVYGLVYASNTFLEAIITILEIPSWFLVWEGMRKILIESKDKESDANFYKKMASANVIFRGY